MRRSFERFLGVDLGGGKGKTTAVARLEVVSEGVLEVVEVGTSRFDAQQPWYDDILIDYLGLHAKGAVLSVDAPLTLTACVRCREPVCPGLRACEDPAIVWFRTEGDQLIAQAIEADRDRIAAIPANGKPRRNGNGNGNGNGHAHGHASNEARTPKPLITPYTQRCTEVVLHRQHGIQPRETLGQGMGPLTARAAHLTRALGRHGYALNQNLIEVYPKATIHQLWGHKIARRYKREVDTWETRAHVLESLRGKVEFSATSRMAREDCLRNDHCFDAVICAYTGYLWATQGWQMPEQHRPVYEVDGWIWAPGV